MILAPPRYGYGVLCQGYAVPARNLEAAARELAAARNGGVECRVKAYCTESRMRELHDWERTSLIELATVQLAATGQHQTGLGFHSRSE